jgi:hypothetical protein
MAALLDLFTQHGASRLNSSLSLSCGRTLVSSCSSIAIARSLDRTWGSATAGLMNSLTSSRRIALPTRALALAVRGGNQPRELRRIDLPCL